MELEQRRRMREASTEGALPLHQVSESLKAVPQWSLQGRSIVREFGFRDFRQAMGFVNQVAKEAEERNHHPDLFISYNKVKLELSTHSVGGLTEKDFDLATEVDRLVSKCDAI